MPNLPQRKPAAKKGGAITLLPGPPLGVRGHRGNAYDVPPTCSHPECDRPAAHVHHVWPRSFLRGQPYEWVRFDDGLIVGNRLGFCVEHHEQLTGQIGGYQSRLIWRDRTYWWEDRNSVGAWSDHEPVRVMTSPGWLEGGRLKHQPPIFDGDGEQEAHGHVLETDVEICPTCGHHKRKPEREDPKPGRARPTKEWTIVVPDDAEVGADLLDDWIEDFAIVFGLDHYTSRLKRYHVLSLLRGVTLAMRKDIIEEVAAAAGRRAA